MLLDSGQHLDDASCIGVDDPPHHDEDAYHDVLQAASSITTMRRIKSYGLKLHPLTSSHPTIRDERQRIVIKKRPLSLLTSFGNNRTCTNDEHAANSNRHSSLVDEAVRIVDAHDEYMRRSSSTSTSSLPPNKKTKLSKKNNVVDKQKQPKQAKKMKKKTVHFAGTVQVAYCDGDHIDPTSKDFNLIWYTKHDYDSFKDECRRTLYHLDHSGPPSSSYCDCGCDCCCEEDDDNNSYCDCYNQQNNNGCNNNNNTSIISHQSLSSYQHHNNNTFDYYNYCIRGLEEQITPEIYHTRKSRKEYYVRSILQEQEYQRKQFGYYKDTGGCSGYGNGHRSYYYDANKFKMISMIQTKQCKEFALEIAKLDSTIHDD